MTKSEERKTTLEEFQTAPEPEGYCWINVYYITRKYGGPEEGGWWYDHWDCVDSHRGRLEESEEDEKELREEYEGDAWGDKSSMRGGLEVRVLVEDTFEKSATRGRPHYE